MVESFQNDTFDGRITGFAGEDGSNFHSKLV